MPDALIGYTGFVGSTLLQQRSFDGLYRSLNIREIAKQHFQLVVCAGAPAQKWIANRDPEADRKNVEGLISQLESVTCETFVLISTVDVFATPAGVDEDSGVETKGLRPYGLHRRMLEEFVERRFARRLIVRLPGLVGPGLRKNVIFDLLNDNNVHAIDSRGVFQFYPTVNLWLDLRRGLEARLSLVHLTAEPLEVSEIAKEGFGRQFEQKLPGTPAQYDFRSRHAAVFGGASFYQYSRRESILAIRAYAQTEQPSMGRVP